MENKLIAMYSNLIWYVVNKFYGVDKEDLYQTGVEALLEAYKKYKEEKGTKFSSYAYTYIYGAMYKLVNNKTLKVSRDILKLRKLIEKASEVLTQKNGWVPSIKELSEFLEYDEESIKYAIEASNPLLSIDENNEETRNLHEIIPDEREDNPDNHILIEDSLNNLSPLERDIITSRYYEDLTQSETAKKLGITQVKVSRYEKRSLTKMRDYINL